MFRKSRDYRITGVLDPLFRYAVSLCGQEDVARDLVQDASVKAVAAKKAPDDEKAFRVWIFKILRNAYFDQLRRQRSASEWASDETIIKEQLAEYSNADERLVDVITVKQAFAQLTPDHREIIGLVDLSGFSYAEAAEYLGVPVGTVMSRMSRARSAMLREISDSSVYPLPMKRSRGVNER